MRPVRSRTFHRSILAPRDRGRIVVSLALAVVGPLALTPLSIGPLETLPALPYYLAIALAARVGRLVAGVAAIATSVVLLLEFAFAGAARPDPLWIPLTSFILLSALLSSSIALERAAAARTALSQARLRLLADATRILEGELDSHATLQRLAERIVPELADWCAIHVVEGAIAVPIAVAHPDPAKVALARRLQEDYPPDPADPQGLYGVIRSGKPAFYPEIPEAMLVASARDPEHLEVIRSLAIRSAIVAPMTARGRTFGAMTLIAAETAWRYDEDDVTFVMQLAARAASIVDAVAAYEMERDALVRERVLQRFSDALTRAVTVQEVLDVIVRDAIAMVGADRSLIAMLDPEGDLLTIAAQWGYDATLTDRWHRFPVGSALPLSDAVRTARTIVVEDRAARDARYPALAEEPMDDRTLVCLPLRAEGEGFGGISISFPQVRAVDDAQLASLETIASHAAQALRRAVLFEERDRTARALQSALLPGDLPRVEGMRLAAGYWPTGRPGGVGGDFYDVLQTGTSVVAVVGDVCGRGPEAAAITGVVRTTIRALSREGVGLPGMFDAVNEALLAEAQRVPGTFVTVCAVALGPADGSGDRTIEVVCAGHPHPVIVGGSEPTPIGISNLALGIESGAAMRAEVATLRAGEGIVLYTDGLAERTRRHVPIEEDPALRDALARTCVDGPDTLVGAIESALTHTPKGHRDDVAILVLCTDGTPSEAGADASSSVVATR